MNRLYKNGVVLAVASAWGLCLPAAAAWNFFDPTDEAQVPGTISATGFYTDMAARISTPEAIYYEINAPFFADSAVNQRFVILPPGKQIVFTDTTDVYEYPDSATFLNNFFIDFGSENGGLVLFETRIITNKKTYDTTVIPLAERTTPADSLSIATLDSWHGFTYAWRPDGMDADLVSTDEGLDTTIQVFPNGAAGAPVDKKWRFPSQDDCRQCHLAAFPSTRPPRTILGFYNAQLNRPSPFDPAKNQLTQLFELGVFAPLAVPVNPAVLPQFADPMDTTATLEHRTRSYLAGQCSGCHGDRGLPNEGTMGMTEINFDYYDLQHHGEIWANRWLMSSYGLTHCNPDPYLVTPGDPTCSGIIRRQTQRNFEPGKFSAVSAQMPPLGTYLVNKAAISLMAEWICSLDPVVCASACPNGAADCVAGIGSRVSMEDIQTPWLDRQELVLPASMAAGALVQVELRDMKGRVLALQKVDEGRYRIPDGAGPGMYAIVVGEREFFRYLH